MSSIDVPACASCGQPFESRRRTQAYCSPTCRTRAAKRRAILKTLPSTPAAEVSQAKAQISVIERRLKSGRIFSQGSQPLPMKEPGRLTVRVVNTQISDSRLWEMQADKGWTYLTRDDLAVSPEEVGFREQDGRLVRGTHGYEVLMCMPARDYEAVQKQKDTSNRETTFSKKHIQSAVTSRAAASVEDGGLGTDGRGAEFLDRAQLTVVDSLERVRLDE